MTLLHFLFALFAFCSFIALFYMRYWLFELCQIPALVCLLFTVDGWLFWGALGCLPLPFACLFLRIRRFFRRLREADPDYSWRHQILLALDQALNVFPLRGYADETISARCWRLQSHSHFWRFMLRFVDWLFSRWEKGHCLKSWQAEQRGSQLPPEYRATKQEAGNE